MKVNSIAIRVDVTGLDKAKQLENYWDRVMECSRREQKYTAPLSDGKELRETSYKKQQFVQSQALALLDSLGASGEQIAACYHSTIIRFAQNIQE